MYALLSLPVGLAVSLGGLLEIMSETLCEFEASFNRALKEKYPRAFELVHWLPSGYSEDRKLPCCQKLPSTMGRVVSTADPNKVTCRPWGYDLNRAWQRLTDELEATKQ